MNVEQARRLEQWAARQFKAMAGGYTAAAGYPDSPIKPKVLGEAAQGLRRLTVADLLYLCGQNGRADMLRSLADMLDEECASEGLAETAHQQVYSAADVARMVDDAERDGMLTAGEIEDIRRLAAEHANKSADLVARVEAIRPGPIKEAGQ